MTNAERAIRPTAYWSCACGTDDAIALRPFSRGDDLMTLRRPEEVSAEIVMPTPAIAYHEAGHAVIAWVHGLHVLCIESALQKADARNHVFVTRTAGPCSTEAA